MLQFSGGGVINQALAQEDEEGDEEEISADEHRIDTLANAKLTKDQAVIVFIRPKVKVKGWVPTSFSLHGVVQGSINNSMRGKNPNKYIAYIGEGDPNNVKLNGMKLVGQMKIKKGLIHYTTPGKHDYIIYSEGGTPAMLRAELDPGKIHFVVVRSTTSRPPDFGFYLVEPATKEMKDLRKWIKSVSYIKKDKEKDDEWLADYGGELLRFYKACLKHPQVILSMEDEEYGQDFNYWVGEK